MGLLTVTRWIRSPCRWARDVTRTLRRLEFQLRGLENQLNRMEVRSMAALDDLEAQVAANTSLEQSAITLIEGIAAQLAAAGTDAGKLGELQTRLATSAAALAAAITANTPAAPEPAPVDPLPVDPVV